MYMAALFTITKNGRAFLVAESGERKGSRILCSVKLSFENESKIKHDKAILGFPGGASGNETACQCRRPKRCRFNPWVRKIPWRRKRLSTPVFLSGESHGQRSLAGHSPWGHKDSDAIE